MQMEGLLCLDLLLLLLLLPMEQRHLRLRDSSVAIVCICLFRHQRVLMALVQWSTDFIEIALCIDEGVSVRLLGHCILRLEHLRMVAHGCVLVLNTSSIQRGLLQRIVLLCDALRTCARSTCCVGGSF